MIFVTVGTQLSFDRLISLVDDWAFRNNIEIFAQIGDSAYLPKNFKYKKFISPDEYDYYIDKATLIVSHAGMGTIINSLLKKKPIVIFPRDATLGEHRNDHQISTCNLFSSYSGIYTARGDIELLDLLNKSNSLVNGSITDNSVTFSNNLYDAVRDLLR